MVTVSTNMAGRGTDILLGGNPEYMAKEQLRKQGKDPDRMQTAAVGTPERQEWDALLTKYRAETAAEHDEVVEPGRAAHRGHGAARIAAHRQSASRTSRTPGRSRQRALLPVLAGRSDAHFRRPAHADADAAAGHGRGCADREQDDHQANCGGAEGCGGAELRIAQTHSRVRRRDEQAAPGGVRDAPGAARGPGSEGASHRDHRRDSRIVHRPPLPRKRTFAANGTGPAWRPIF